jgi:hypothetical protein
MKIIFPFIAILLLAGCNYKTTFHKLELHKLTFNEGSNHVNGIFNQSPKGNKIYEYVIIDNIPENQVELKNIIIKYFDSINDLQKLDPLLSEHVMLFYKLSSNTKPFLNSTRNYSGISRNYLDDRRDDFLYKLIFRRYIDISAEYKIVVNENKFDTILKRGATNH